jgi:hypothetical protein
MEKTITKNERIIEDNLIKNADPKSLSFAQKARLNQMNAHSNN